MSDDAEPSCRTFALYRTSPPEEYFERDAAVDVDSPQLYGCVFPDGTTVIRWMTSNRSIAIFSSFDDFTNIHGHPEYGTRIEWEADALRADRDALSRVLRNSARAQEWAKARELLASAQSVLQGQIVGWKGMPLGRSIDGFLRGG